MALYEYLCPACRKGFELMRPMSEAHKNAACPVCGSEAQRIISGVSSAEDPTQVPTEPSKNDSRVRTTASEVMTANQRTAMLTALDLERSTGPHGGPSGGSVREDMDLRRSAATTALSAPTAIREGVAADSEVDLHEDTTPIEMPSLTESQPGGGNLWYIRDWGIASMFGYVRRKWAPEPVGELPFTVAGMDARPAESEGYRRTLGQGGEVLVDPDSAPVPVNGVGSHPTFSEWRAAISIMPWLQETGMESPETDKENTDMASGEPDMPGPQPRRDKARVYLPWARWPYSGSAGKRAANLDRRPRPAKEGLAADFPNKVIEAAWRRQGGRCAGCGRWLIRQYRDRESGSGAWESHHRVPADQGGSHLLANCVLLCSGAADCHFNLGHGGIGWTHYAPLDESALLFIFAGSVAATVPTTPVRPKRSLLREILGIPQLGGGGEKPRDESSGRES
jgi:putative FmdB family regulatory protein